MYLNLFHGYPDRVPRRVRRRGGWVACPGDRSVKAALLARLPRFVRQGVRRLGFRLPVTDIYFGAVSRGRTCTAREIIAEAARNLKPGGQIVFEDGRVDPDLTARFAEALSESRRPDHGPPHCNS